MNDSGASVIGIAIGVIGAIALGALWLSAALLGGGPPTVESSDAIAAMVFDGHNAAQAWRLDRPVWLYWITTAALGAAGGALSLGVWRLLWSAHWGTRRRERLGSSTESRLAETKDLEALWTKWGPTRRFLLGQTAPKPGQRSKLLAAEWKADPNKAKLSRGARERVGDRGAVMVLGPSRSGKTVTALSGVLMWDGPVVLSSVKDDLIDPTLANRRRVGEVAVFDPSHYLDKAYRGEGRPSAWDERLRAGWSPLRAATTFEGASRAANGLAEAGPESGSGHNAMWVTLASNLLRGLLFVAASSGASMRSVMQWVTEQDQPGANGDEGHVWALLEPLMEDPDPTVRRDAFAAYNTLQSVWSQDAKIASSVYTTAVSLIESWMSPAVAESSAGNSISLDWLCSGNNSLYLVAPPADAKRMSPVFGGMITDLLEQCFEKVARDGKPLDPPLLVVLDEAANMPLDRLPDFVSTVAGLGVQLVTVWQSLAQVNHLYGTSADTVISNHLTKVVYTGVSDVSTLEYIQKITGEEEVETTVNSADKYRYYTGSTQLQGTRLGLTPMHVIRTMPTGHSLLIHGSLLPAHIRSVPWYQQKKFTSQMEWEPGDERGLPLSLNSVDEWDDWDLDEDASAPESGQERENRASPMAQMGFG